MQCQFGGRAGRLEWVENGHKDIPTSKYKTKKVCLEQNRVTEARFIKLGRVYNAGHVRGYHIRIAGSGIQRSFSLSTF